MAVLLLVAQSPAMKAADSPPSPTRHRVSAIDGLRGFLAFGVFFHHAVINYRFVKTGVWTFPSSNFYRMLGPLAVDLFFIITGYLFWTKAIHERGRMNLWKLYIGRAFRIGPLYLFAVVSMLMIVAYRTGFHLHQRAVTVLEDTAGWLALGIVFPRDVNGYLDTNRILAGVTWTLYYEWMFYFSLAATSFVAPFKYRMLAVLSVAYAVVLASVPSSLRRDPNAVAWACAALFVAGMLCATLESENLLLRTRPWIKSLLSAILIGLVFSEAWIPNSALPVLVASFFFYLLVSGNTFFGLLTSRAAHRLGNISYGVYLLQGLVLTLSVAVPLVRNVALRSPVCYWSFTLVCALILTALATATHVSIERPGIDAGRRLIGKLERRMQSRVHARQA